jgi:hypothetical protein
MYAPAKNKICGTDEGFYNAGQVEAFIAGLRAETVTYLASKTEEIKRKGSRCARMGAAEHKVPLLVIHCPTSEEITERRLRLRAAQGTDVSDGRWEIYLEQKATYELMNEFTPESVLELVTDAPLEHLVRDCEAFLRSRLA